MRLDTLHKFIINNIQISFMCPMASVNELFPDPCKSNLNSSMVLKGGRIFPPKTTFGSHIGFSIV